MVSLHFMSLHPEDGREQMGIPGDGWADFCDFPIPNQANLTGQRIQEAQRNRADRFARKRNISQSGHNRRYFQARDRLR